MGSAVTSVPLSANRSWTTLIDPFTVCGNPASCTGSCAIANRPHTVNYVPGQASGRAGLVSIAAFAALAVYVARRPTRRSVLGIGLVLGAASGNVLSIHLFAGGAPN